MRQETSQEARIEPSAIQIASGSALIFASTFFGLGLNFIHSIVLARLLEPERFGLYALGLATFNVLSVISIAGLDSAALRFIPSATAQATPPATRNMVQTITGMSFCISSIFGLALLALSSTIAVRIFHRSELTSILALFSLAVPLFAISTIFLASLQAMRDIRWRVFVKYGCEPVIKFSITVSLLTLGWDVAGAVIALIVALCSTLGLAYIPLSRLLPPTSSPSPANSLRSKIFQYSLPLLGSLIFASLSNRSDILLLGYWLPSNQAGIYSAAFQSASIIALILGSFDSVASPLISNAIALNDRFKLEQLLQMILRWSVSLSFPLFLTFILFPTAILEVFGRDFSQGATCLTILAFSQLANAATGSASTTLLVAGYSRLTLWNSICTGFIQIGLNLVLIPWLGMTGAAIGTATALVLLSIIRLTECFRLLDVMPFGWTIWKPFVAGLISFLIVSALEYSSLAPRLAVLLLTLITSYCLSLSLLGLEEEDRLILSHFKSTSRRYLGANP